MFTFLLKTPRLIRVHNVWLGVLVRLSQIAVICYVLTYAIWLERGYQVGQISMLW